eukprot:COSAG02_NODE_700_length_18341_cov_52.629043_18_plen_119_part_00
MTQVESAVPQSGSRFQRLFRRTGQTSRRTYSEWACRCSCGGSVCSVFLTDSSDSIVHLRASTCQVSFLGLADRHVGAVCVQRSLQLLLERGAAETSFSVTDHRIDGHHQQCSAPRHAQ